MFTRKIRVCYMEGATLTPCPIKWLDNFAMRSFTNDAVFDDTLPTADGLLEIGSRVPVEQLKTSMEDWFRRKGYIGKAAELTLSEA